MRFSLLLPILVSALSAVGCPAERAPVVGQKCVSDADCAGPYLCRQPSADSDRVCLFGVRPFGATAEPEGNPEPDVTPEPGPQPEPGVQPEPGIQPEPGVNPEPEPEPGLCPEGYAFDAAGACTRTRTFPSMPNGRAYHTATEAGAGRLFIAGGLSESSTVPSEAILYDANGAQLPSFDLANPAYAGGASVLSDGRILLAGGLTIIDGGALPVQAYAIDVDAQTETFLTPISTPRYLHRLIRAGDVDQFHLVGGATVDPSASSIETFFATGGSTIFQEQPALGVLPATVSISPTTAMVFGGTDFDNPELGINGAYEIDGDGQTTPLPSIPDPVHLAAAVLNPAGTAVIVSGGIHSEASFPTNSIYRFDLANQTWTFAGTLSSARSGHAMAFQPQTDRLLVFGGSGEGGPVATVEVVDFIEPGFALSTVITTLSEARQQMEMTVMSSGAIVLSGGVNINGVASGAVDVIDSFFP